MNDVIKALINDANDWARFLFVWSWQVCLLLAAVYLLVRLSRFRAATIRYQVWFVALVAVVLLPVCTSLVQNVSTAKAPVTPITFIIDAPVDILASTAVPSVDRFSRPSTADASAFRLADLWALALLAWATGVLFALKQLLASYWRAQKARRLARAVSLAELECQDMENSLVAASMHGIKLSESITSPHLVGLLHPTILLPADIAQWTTAEERKTILLHEMIHARRRDQWANYFQSFVRAVFFFHPLVRYASNQLSIEREPLPNGQDDYFSGTNR